MRKHPGRSLVALPLDYVVVDLETTGLSSTYAEIIEMAALRVRDGEIVESFQQLVRPWRGIPPGITELTGITNGMVEDAPPLEEVLGTYMDFIGGDILLGHNVSFDIRFLYDRTSYLGIAFSNDFVNTVRSARKAVPGLPGYRLEDLCRRIGIESKDITFHRALADCVQTHRLYLRLRECFESEEALQACFSRKRSPRPSSQ